VTLAELIANLSAQQADATRLRRQVDEAALLGDVLAQLDQVDGTDTSAGHDLNTHDAAKQLGLASHRTVENWCRQGRFPNAYHTSGERGDWRIPVSDVAAYRGGQVRRDGVTGSAAVGAGASPAPRRALSRVGRGSGA